MVMSLAALIPAPAADRKDMGAQSGAPSRNDHVDGSAKPQFNRLLDPPPAQSQRASNRQAEPLKDTQPERSEPLKSAPPPKDSAAERPDPDRSGPPPKDSEPRAADVPQRDTPAGRPDAPSAETAKAGEAKTPDALVKAGNAESVHDPLIDGDVVYGASDMELLAAMPVAGGVAEAQTVLATNAALAASVGGATNGDDQATAASALLASHVASAQASQSVAVAAEAAIAVASAVAEAGTEAATSAEPPALPAAVIKTVDAGVKTATGMPAADQALTNGQPAKDAGGTNLLAATPADPKTGEAATSSSRASDNATPGIKTVPDTGSRPVFADWLQDFVSVQGNGHRLHDPLAGLDRASTSPVLGGSAETARPTPLQLLPIEIGMQAMRGVTKFQIRLDPAELGRVDVSLEIRDSGEVEASLVVDRVETLALLKRDASTLQTAFEQAGLKQSPDGLTFSLRGDGQKGEGQKGREQQAPGQSRQDEDHLPIQNQIAGMAMRRMMIPHSSIDRVI